MKESYLKVVLLLLIFVVAIQGYFLYDFYNAFNEKRVSSKAENALVVSSIVPFVSFFDKNEDPLAEMDRLHREMEDRLMYIEKFFKTVPSMNKVHSKLYRIPRFDMKEQDGKYFITIEVPGIDEKAIKVKTENGHLLVSAHVSKEKDNNTTTYYQQERRTSSYKHAISLPSDINETSLNSEYKNGLLTITFEKIVP